MKESPIKKTHSIDDISLSSIKAIKALIKFKNKFMIMLEHKLYQDTNGIINNESFESYESIGIIYLDLALLIKATVLSTEESKVIEHLLLGESIGDISKLMNCSLVTAYKTFQLACEKIQKEYIRQNYP